MKKLLLILFLVMLCGFNDSALADFGKYSKEMQIAVKLINQGKAHQAKAVYIALLLKSPQFYPARLGLATINTRQYNFIDSEKYILSAINTGANNADAYERLAYNYYEWARTEKDSKEHLLNKASDAIQKALNLDKNNSKVYSTYALLNIENKEFEKALQNLHDSLDLNPQNQDALTNLGILYTKLKKFDLAQDQFERAVNIDPTDSRPYRNYGIMLAEANQYRQSIHYLKEAQFYDIYTSYKEHFLLATLYEKVGSLNKAIEEYYATLELKPDFTDCYTQIAKLYENIGEEEKSIEAYKKAVAQDYRILEAMITRSQDLLRSKDYMRSRPLLIKILKIEEGNKYAFDGLCSYYYMQGIEEDLDLENWYKDSLFLKDQFALIPSDNYLAQVSWQKFFMAKDGLTETIAQNLNNLSLISPEKPEDYAAIGEALFLQRYFYEANSKFNESINKYVSYFANEHSTEKAGEELLLLGDRLNFDHEMIASRKIYDKAIELNSNESAIEGLTILSKTSEKADYIFNQIYNIEKTTNYNAELIKNLNNAIKFYPQNSEAYFILQETYSKIGDYDNALKELKTYANLAEFNNFNGAPKTEKVRKLLEKYSTILMKREQLKKKQAAKEEALKEKQEELELNKLLEEAEKKHKEKKEKEKEASKEELLQ